MTRQWFSAAAVLALVLAALMAGGCGAAAVVGRAIPKSVDAEYKGLAGQKIAVMVWADRGTRIDYPNLQLDTANAIQANLIAKLKEDELKDAQFPWEARSVLRFQKEHPQYEGRPITEYAQRISGITRLIYVEIPYFSTRSETAVQLLKGGITGNVKVVEIENGKAKVAYDRSGIKVSYPPKVAGVLDQPESLIYAGTVTLFSKNVAELFYGHVVEDE